MIRKLKSFLDGDGGIPMYIRYGIFSVGVFLIVLGIVSRIHG